MARATKVSAALVFSAGYGYMVINRFQSKRENLRICIFSPAKTGNTWLRFLLCDTYSLRDIDLPSPFSAKAADELGSNWITHSHIMPTPELVNWLVSNDILVITTVRHPGDTLLSLFHYIRWAGSPTDPAYEMISMDDKHPGEGLARYAKSYYASSYALIVAWSSLGSHVVRYEDLLADPLVELRKLAANIQPVSEAILFRAILLGEPSAMRSSGFIEARHVRKAEAGNWRVELPEHVVQYLKESEPFINVCKTYGYDWLVDAGSAEQEYFDYLKVNPFGPSKSFDNGDPICLTLACIYLNEIAAFPDRWVNPLARTDAGSFWSWLTSPCPEALTVTDFPPATLTNLMLAICKWRTDVVDAFPDPFHQDRLRFANWFIERGQVEFGISWRLIDPIFNALLVHCQAGHESPENNLLNITPPSK